MYLFKIEGWEAPVEQITGQAKDGNEGVSIAKSPSNERKYKLKINGAWKDVYVEKFDPETRSFIFRLNGKRIKGGFETREDLYLKRIGKAARVGAKTGGIKAPMPGLIRKISVAPGDVVEKGDTVFILEAMKMENLIKAPGDGVVKAIFVQPNAAVEKGQPLLEFEA